MKIKSKNENMKLIDLLINKAKGKLKQGTKIVLLNRVYEYNKKQDLFVDANNGYEMGCDRNLDRYLKEEIIIF